jgi:plasmid maintenance system antidote protein VapI
MLLNRGLTNGSLAAVLSCSPRTIRGIINGEPGRCSGKMKDRLLEHLRKTCPPVAEQLVLVTERRK